MQFRDMLGQKTHAVDLDLFVIKEGAAKEDKEDKDKGSSDGQDGGGGVEVQCTTR